MKANIVAMAVRKKRLNLSLYKSSTMTNPTNNIITNNRNAAKLIARRVDNTVGKRNWYSLILAKKVLKGAKNNRVKHKVIVAKNRGK